MLFLGRLRELHILDDRREEFLRVVTQLFVGHLDMGRDQRLREGGKFADDFFVVAANELG